jgi:hypothetical protein
MRQQAQFISYETIIDYGSASNPKYMDNTLQFSLDRIFREINHGDINKYFIQNSEQQILTITITERTNTNINTCTMQLQKEGNKIKIKRFSANNDDYKSRVIESFKEHRNKDKDKSSSIYIDYTLLNVMSNTEYIELNPSDQSDFREALYKTPDNITKKIIPEQSTQLLMLLYEHMKSDKERDPSIAKNNNFININEQVKNALKIKLLQGLEHKQQMLENAMANLSSITQRKWLRIVNDYKNQTDPPFPDDPKFAKENNVWHLLKKFEAVKKRIQEGGILNEQDLDHEFSTLFKEIVKSSEKRGKKSDIKDIILKVKDTPWYIEDIRRLHQEKDSSYQSRNDQPSQR